MNCLLICPYFGEFPSWMAHYWVNASRLADHGYTIFVPQDEDDFRARVRAKMGIECPPMWGTGNVWDFRPALAELYDDVVEEYDWWGHTDFDCVYGRVENYMTPQYLDGVDIYANHHDYICGAWTLYRNTEVVNSLFRESPVWQQKMEDPNPTGWAEVEYTHVVDAAHAAGRINRKYEVLQTRDWNRFDSCWLREDGALMEGNDERMLAHFRRSKVYPERCKL